MEKVVLGKEKQFEIYKMCPPNTTVYYFFSNPIENDYTPAHD